MMGCLSWNARVNLKTWFSNLMLRDDHYVLGLGSNTLVNIVDSMHV